MSRRTPQDAHPDFTPDRLAFIAERAAEVWKGAIDDHHEAKGDGPLGLGVRFFERTAAQVRKASRELPWLRVIEKGLHLVFTFGAVPARIYRGLARRPKKGYMNINAAEHAAHQLAFAFAKDACALHYRIVVEAVYGQIVPRVFLVEISAKTGKVEDVWELSTVSGAPSLTPVIDMRPPPVKTIKPKVSPKRPKPNKKVGSDEDDGK